MTSPASSPKDSRPPAVLRRFRIASSDRRAVSPLLWAPLLLAGVAAAAYVCWFWRQSERPGIRHYLRGMDYMAARYPVQARAEWLKGVQEDPGDYHCFEQLGNYFSEVRQPEEAVNCYAAACARAPRNGSLFLLLAAAEQRTRQPHEALAAARRAYELRPNDADAAGLYGMLLKEARNRPAALQVLRRAHELRPNDRTLLLAMVNAELDSLDFAAAERDIRPYLQSHRGDAEACYFLTVIENQKPRTPANVREAIDLASRAMAGLPGDPRPRGLLGQLYLDSDRVNDALRVYQEGARAFPHSEAMLRGLVDCYSRLGKNGERAVVTARLQQVLARHDRIDHLTHVMSFNHANTTAGLELARLTEEDGQYSAARTYFEQLVRQAPHDPRTRKALAGFYARHGRPDKARLALQPQFMP